MGRQRCGFRELSASPTGLLHDQPEQGGQLHSRLGRRQSPSPHRQQQLNAHSFSYRSSVSELVSAKLAYLKIHPPSTWMDSPVTYSDSSEAKNATTLPISRGWP